jgi:hypothetical protein
MRAPRIALAPILSFIVLGGLVSAPAGGALAARPHMTSTLLQAATAAQIRLTPIGAPTWKPVDLHVFSAPIGTAESEYREFLETALEILPPPNHQFHPALGVGPGEPHKPPYNMELGEGIDELGFHQGARFDATEFSEGNGVWLAWMNIPSPGTRGSSPDFSSGRIIPNTLFPIRVTVSTTHDGQPFSGPFTFEVPPLDATLDPPFSVDGHSHFPIFTADNRDSAPSGDVDPTGRYTFHTDMTDQDGAGWRIEATFAVRP